MDDEQEFYDILSHGKPQDVEVKKEEPIFPKTVGEHTRLELLKIAKESLPEGSPLTDIISAAKELEQYLTE